VARLPVRLERAPKQLNVVCRRVQGTMPGQPDFEE
jgi:hypothetical protein